MTLLNKTKPSWREEERLRHDEAALEASEEF